METFTWTVTALLMLIGLAGVIVPLLPGTALILIAAIFHKWMLPDALSWATVGWMGALWAVSVVADFGGVMIGARLFGGGKWGMAGAGAGALVGLFFSLPGLILGTIFGAVAAEKFIAKKSGRDSLLAGAGAATGFLISTVLRAACAVAMIVLFLSVVLSAGR